MIGASMAVRPPRSRGPVLMMIDALRRLGGTLFYVSDNLAGTYVDNAGTTPVTAVADLIGLITDKSYSGQLGVELLSWVWNNSYVNTFDTFTSTSFGGFTGSTAGAKTNVRVFVPFTGSVSDFYEIRFNISMSGATCKLLMYSTAHSGVQFIRGSAGVDPGVVSGEVVVRCVLTASGVNGIMLGFDTSAGGTVTVTSASSRKVPGNHATQSAVASKPSVQRVPKRLGPNLVVNASWTAPAIGGPTYSTFLTGAVVSAGKSYRVSAVVSGYGGTGTVGFTSTFTGGTTAAAAEANGTITGVANVSSSGEYTMFTRSTNTAVFTNIVIQEVLEWANVISFDGSNDFLQTGITTGNEGFVAAGVTFGAVPGAALQLLGTTANGGLDGAGILVTTGGASVLMSVGTGGAQHFATRAAPVIGVPSVIDGGWNSSTLFVATNGIETSSARSGVATSPGTLTIGTRQVSPLGYFGGHAHGFAYTPVLPSAADRKIIRDGIAALQGRTL